MNTTFLNNNHSSVSDEINARGYGAAAQAKHTEAEALKEKMRSLKRTKWLMVAILCLLDLCLFYQPITATLYDTSELENAVLSVACAVGPILTAVWTASFIRAAMFDGEENPRVNIAIASGLAILTVALLYQGWQVRSNYWGDDTGTGLYLNVVAVAFALFAFAIDFMIERRLLEARFALDVAETERDLLTTMDYKSHFAFMKEIDEARRIADDADIVRARRGVIEAGLDAAGRARKALAKRVARSAEEFDFIMDTPFKVGSKMIEGDSKAELLDKVAKELGATEDPREDWGPAKSRYLGEKQLEELDEFSTRLDAIRTIGASGAIPASRRSDEDDGPIQAQYEVVY